MPGYAHCPEPRKTPSLGKRLRHLLRDIQPRRFAAETCSSENSKGARGYFRHRSGRLLPAAEHKRVTRLSSEKIEAYLDAGNGDLYLPVPRVAASVAQTLAHFDGVRYRIFAWCVMPNHVHVVFQPLEGHSLPEILHTWKSYLAKRANRLLRRSGEFRQREYYDHLVRDERDLRRIVRYVLENPTKAGLTNWPWVGTGAPMPKAK